ncbi:hypothetical protein [Alsobacter sp. R-9]
MPFKNDLVSLIDEGHRSKTFGELAASPPGILAGLTHAQGAKLMQALDVDTLQDLAQSRYVLWSQSITHLARYEKVDGFNPSLAAILDGQWEKKSLRELARARPSIFTGLSAKEATMLEEAAGIRTVEDLATNRFVLMAQVIAHLARYETSTGPAQKAA